MKGTQIFIIGLVVLILMAGTIVMNNKNNSVKPEVKQTVTEIPTQSMAPVLLEISMTAKQWEFTPSEIKVKMGQPVKLTIKSIDVEHGISIPDFNVSAKLQPNVDTVVEFTPDKKGTFTFSCNVLCGEGHKNMKGTLIVE